MTGTSDFGLGIVGCGDISGIYLQNFATLPGVRVVAVSDLDPERARARGAELDGPRVLSTGELLQADDVAIVVNLTTPDAHAEVARAAVENGKHVYNEKPLCISIEDALALRDAALAGGVRLGAAPDTFLGAGLQTVREIIDGGRLGEIVAGNGAMVCRGHESWHPDPGFYYRRGGGPLLDMGPYYVTALVTLLGPVRRVTGSARRSFPTRTITSEGRHGEKIPVEVPTHDAAVLDFRSGAVVTITTTFDVHGSRQPLLELHGELGSVSAPDPNTFGGPVEVLLPPAPDWQLEVLRAGPNENRRGLGVAEMADAIRADRPHRASADLAIHVLDVLHALHRSSELERHETPTTTCERPAPMPPGWGNDVAGTDTLGVEE